MSVRTFLDYTPAPRADAPWTQVRIEESASATGPWTIIDTQTLSPVDSDPLQPRSRDFTTTAATLEEGWYRVTFRDAAGNSDVTDVVHYTAVSQRQLVSLAALKDSLGITGTQDDDKLSAAIDAATSMVVAYTERAFATIPVTEERTFLYDGGGFLEIDDCFDITAVSINSLVLTSELDYFAQPFNGEVYTWLDLGTIRNQSPQMGFTRNLDQDWVRARLVSPAQRVAVTATWGWPQVPAAVQQAAIWVAAAFMDSAKPFISESIANYAVTRQALGEAVPDRAQKILDLYKRVHL